MSEQGEFWRSRREDSMGLLMTVGVGLWDKSSNVSLLQGSPFEETLHLSMSQWRELFAMSRWTTIREMERPLLNKPMCLAHMTDPAK